MQFTIILNALIFLVQMQCENALLIETNSHDLGSDFMLQTAHYGVKILSGVTNIMTSCYFFVFHLNEDEKFRKYLVKLCMQACDYHNLFVPLHCVERCEW